MSQCIIKGYCTIVVFGWIINTLFINTHLDDVTPNCLSVDFNQHQDTKLTVFFLSTVEHSTLCHKFLQYRYTTFTLCLIPPEAEVLKLADITLTYSDDLA